MLVMDAIAGYLKRKGVSTLFCYPTTNMIEAAAAAGVPGTIMHRLANDLRTVVAKDDMQQFFAQNAITPGVIATQAARKIVDEDHARMGKLVAQSGAKAN